MAIKEINRRINYFVEDGIACGPVSMAVVEAEIEVEDEGEKVYLYGEWVDAAGEYSYAATKESVYDVLLKYHETGDRDDALIDEHNRILENAIADDSRYEPFYEELKAMIDNELKAQGYEIYDDDEFNEDEDEE